MALIELKSNLNTKIGETNTTKNGTFSVNQRDNTEKNTQFTNDQVSAQHKKFKPDDDQLITHDIGDGYKGTNKDGGFTRGGFILNTDRQVEDTKRLRKFLTTPKGFLFQTKQGILQKKNTREETRRYDRTSIIRNVDSVTEILDGNVSRAGEQRHRGGNYEKTLKEGGNFREIGTSTFVSASSTTDNAKHTTTKLSTQTNSITYNTEEVKSKYSSDNQYFTEDSVDSSTGLRENISNVGPSTTENERGGSSGNLRDRQKSVIQAASYLSPPPNQYTGIYGFGYEDTIPIPSRPSLPRNHIKPLQVLYGGEFGNLKKVPTTVIKEEDEKGRKNVADLTIQNNKTGGDFIKFKIRDAVNGKWIIFPALITGITDNSQANYSKIQYIGRPDSVHVYQNFNRSISFNIKVLATNERELGVIWQKVSALKGLTQPTFKPFFYDNKNIKSTGEKFTRPTAPYVYLTIGDMFVHTPGYFESVNVTIPEASSWEIIDGAQFPHMCDISCTFQYIGRELPATTSINYDGLRPDKFVTAVPAIRKVIPTGEFT